MGGRDKADGRLGGDWEHDADGPDPPPLTAPKNCPYSPEGMEECRISLSPQFNVLALSFIDIYFMFNDKLEVIMTAESGTLERRGLARGLKICLDILFYLVLAAGLLMVASLTISAFTDYDDGWRLDVPVAIGEGSIFPRLPVEIVRNAPPAFENIENIHLAKGQGLLRFLSYSFPVNLGEEAIALLFLGVFLWAITLLRRILATTAGGRPFDPINPRRLNTLGWIIVSASILTSILQYLASKWLLSMVEVTTIPLSPSILIHKEWILCGLLVLVLAAIWKDAVGMAEEQALTV